MSNSRKIRIPADRPFMKVLEDAALVRTRPIGNPRKIVQPAIAPSRTVCGVLTELRSPFARVAAPIVPNGQGGEAKQAGSLRGRRRPTVEWMWWAILLPSGS